jgi:hypothetical protein
MIAGIAGHPFLQRVVARDRGAQQAQNNQEYQGND